MSKPLLQVDEVKQWVREIYADFAFEIIGFATKSGKVIPLNLEPGTLGNIIEGALIAHLNEKTEGMDGVIVTEGGSRQYPDIELSGSRFNNEIIALDIKAARRKVAARATTTVRTQSRITLYSFGTYLKERDRKHAGATRPFADFKHHVDLIAIFDADEENKSVENFELLVVEPWKVASHKVSSTTRDYIGAVDEIDKLRNEQGEFLSQQEFYDFWAAVPRRGGTTGRAAS